MATVITTGIPITMRIHREKAEVAVVGEFGMETEDHPNRGGFNSYGVYMW